MLPQWVRSVFLGLPKAMPLHFHQDAEDIFVARRAVLAPRDLLHKPITAQAQDNQVVDVIYPQEHCLDREVHLPGAKGAAIGKMLALDTLRATPFKENDIHWSFRADDTGHVTQWIARRDDISALRTRLAGLGLTVRKVLVEGNELGKPLADFGREIAARTRIWRVLNAICLLVLLGLCAYRLITPAWQDQQKMAALDRELTDLRVQTVALRQEADSLRQDLAARDALVKMVTEQVPLVHALREATVAMPDQVWVNDLTYRPPQLQLNGSVSGSAAELVLSLSEGTRLRNPRLNGAVSRGQDLRERFDLIAEIGDAK